MPDKSFTPPPGWGDPQDAPPKNHIPPKALLLAGLGLVSLVAVTAVIGATSKPATAPAAASRTSLAVSTPAAAPSPTRAPAAPASQQPAALPPAPSATAPAPSRPSAAQMLADLDHGSHAVTDYQAALDSLKPKCKEDEYGLAGTGNAALKDLRDNNITDEDELTVLQHLNESLPDGGPRMDCKGIAAAYLVLREGHS